MGAGNCCLVPRLMVVLLWDLCGGDRGKGTGGPGVLGIKAVGDQ